MKLYLQIEDGIPVNHPAYEDNLIAAFGKVPANWEPFIRVQAPELGVYQLFEQDQSTYEKVDDVWTDIWHVRDMTPVEKASKQEQVKTEWIEQHGNTLSSWAFNEETCSYEPPIPYPLDGKLYTWDNENLMWLSLEV